MKARSVNRNLEGNSDHEDSSSRGGAASDELDTHHPILWPSLERYALVFVYFALEAVIFLQQLLYQAGKRLVARKSAIKSSQILVSGVSMNVFGSCNTRAAVVYGTVRLFLHKLTEESIVTSAGENRFM